MMLAHHGALDKLKLFHLEDGGFNHQRDYKFSELLIASPYNYSESEAKKLIQKYFVHILSWNNKNIDKDSMCNRIAFTWYDKNNNVAGFSFRHPSGQELDMKYPYNKGSLKSQMLFNINKGSLNILLKN